MYHTGRTAEPKRYSRSKKALSTYLSVSILFKFRRVALKFKPDLARPKLRIKHLLLAIPALDQVNYSMAASKRLSEAIPVQPQGDRLGAVDHQIERLDLVKWDTSHIKYINFQFNLIEYLNGLSQFKNLVGLDLSNNNVDRF